MQTYIHMKILHSYTNGNADIVIHDDGTRVITSLADRLELEYPLNIDIRISNACPFGLNEKTGHAVCHYCHESATTTGRVADLAALLDKLDGLPAGIELAIGINDFRINGLFEFLTVCRDNGWIVNGTVNQGLIRRDYSLIASAISSGLIKGLGISYRSGMIDISAELLEYKNTVVHVIVGIDKLDDVIGLADKGVKKLLILGEKDFGFNRGHVDLMSSSHVDWYRRFPVLFRLFDVVSFDNLALDQLNVRRFVKDWETMYQHEYSFYINAVDKYFAPSSRSSSIRSYDDISIKDYFKGLVK